MSQIFYDSLVEIEYVHSEIEQLNINEKDKVEIVQLVEETLHYHVVHRILDRLDEDQKPLFLDYLARRPHDHKILDFLKEKIEDIEDQIKDAAEEIKYDILKLIRSKNR